jgi:small subunit ribosomal protein S28e
MGSGKKIVEKEVDEETLKQATAAVTFSGEGTPAQILEIVGSMGTREGGKQARVKLLAGREAGKIMRRNIIGPFKIGDVIVLKETELEASPIKGRKR